MNQRGNVNAEIVHWKIFREFILLAKYPHFGIRRQMWYLLWKWHHCVLSPMQIEKHHSKHSKLTFCAIFRLFPFIRRTENHQMENWNSQPFFLPSDSENDSSSSEYSAISSWNISRKHHQPWFSIFYIPFSLYSNGI